MFRNDLLSFSWANTSLLFCSLLLQSMPCGLLGTLMMKLYKRFHLSFNKKCFAFEFFVLNLIKITLYISLSIAPLQLQTLALCACHVRFIVVSDVNPAVSTLAALKPPALMKCCTNDNSRIVLLMESTVKCLKVMTISILDVSVDLIASGRGPLAASVCFQRYCYWSIGACSSKPVLQILHL